MVAQPLIELIDLSRQFKDLSAVDHLNLSIPQGELFGLVGPDGAGKTTTLRLLAGLLTISSGRAFIAGHELTTHPEAVKSLIGYMAQDFSLYSKLTVMENLLFFAAVYQVPRQVQNKRIDRLLDFAGLDTFKNRRAAHLSGGMKKKLALACTLIHQPQLLLLDEPTTGVDPVSRREFWQILTELHLEGTTILVTTPYMDEADRCGRVGLMYQGKLIHCDSPQAIRAQLQGEIVQLVTDQREKAQRLIRQLTGIKEVQTYGNALHILVDSGPKRLPAIKTCLEKAGLAVDTLRRAPTRMEEAFISLIRTQEKEE